MIGNNPTMAEAVGEWTAVDNTYGTSKYYFQGDALIGSS